MTYHQVMYRNKPKKQDHGTRGWKWSCHRMTWGNCKKGMRLSMRDNYRQAKHKFKSELNKLSIEATDEEIERYFLKTQYRPQEKWYEFD